MGFFDDFQTKGRSYTHEIRRVGKDGTVETVTTEDKDYPAPPPSEKLVWLCGASKPYTFNGQNQKTGEEEEVEYIDFEFQIIAGPRKGDRFLIGMSTKVSDRSNLGKLSMATSGSYVKDVPKLLNQAIRKPFYIFTENEQKDWGTKVKILSARPYDEAVDGPIGNAQAAPVPEPVAAAAGGDDGSALFDVDL